MCNKYPCLEINLTKLKENAVAIREQCHENGIRVAGVVKGFSGIGKVAAVYEEADIDYLASSRLEQLEEIKNEGIKTPCVCIRIPMISELDKLVQVAEFSLQSDVSVLRALDKAAGKAGKKHGVILMADIGDLREGFWDVEELVEAALLVENELPNLELSGVGTNLGCYGSIYPDAEKLSELVDRAESIEAAIGRKLDIISGGSTTSLMRMWDGTIPKRINMLRIGEAIIFAKGLPDFYGVPMDFANRDAFTLKAEIIEIKVKPTHPVGRITMDSFGNKPMYVDRGMRKRALLAIGKVDFGDTWGIVPRLEGVEVVGASSDHMIVDIEDVKTELNVGDVLDFDIRYSHSMYLTISPNVNYAFVK